MTTITDEQMQAMLQTIKPYCMVLLKPGTNSSAEDVQSVLWEHGRRNFGLKADGIIDIVSPVSKEAEIAGLYIFNTSEEEAHAIMKDDPAVKAGIFDFYTYPCVSFPGDCLK